MKNTALFILLFTYSATFSQSLPIDFETSIATEDFIDFDGGMATMISNPNKSGINESETVAQIVRNGGQVWAGSKITLADNLDFSTDNIISMKVLTTAPVGTTVKFKLEGNGSAERDVQTTVSNEWEILTYDFTGTTSDYNVLVFMFDFGNIGDGSANSTFLFDDVEQLFGGTQIDLPVDFEDPTVNYTMTDFEGNASFLTTDPTDETNMVVQAMKTSQASPSAGTTIGTPAGFATDIPLSLTDSKMNVRVWSPQTGTPIRLKVEDAKDPTHTCETETNTTLSGEWETLEFDFLNQAPGTELLSVGLEKGWTYNMASIFFNFGQGGQAVNEVYYFDDVKFGGVISSSHHMEISNLNIFPNPTHHHWNIISEQAPITSIHVYDLFGSLVLRQFPKTNTAIIEGQLMSQGIYIASITTDSGIQNIKIIKE